MPPAGPADGHGRPRGGPRPHPTPRPQLRALARAASAVPRFTGRLSGGGGCRPTHGGGLFGVSGVHGHEAAFRVGAATVDYAPPARGALASDPSDCAPAAVFPGARAFAF